MTGRKNYTQKSPYKGDFWVVVKTIYGCPRRRFAISLGSIFIEPLSNPSV